MSSDSVVRNLNILFSVVVLLKLELNYLNLVIWFGLWLLLQFYQVKTWDWNSFLLNSFDLIFVI